VYIKDLQILTKGRTLEDVIIVDNKIESFCSHLENGIPIKSFMGENDDNRLIYLVKHLMKLKDVKDVRPYIIKDFLLQDIKNKQS
jgi:TFIIF-interacting CTD phosphatase-like protein